MTYIAMNILLYRAKYNQIEKNTQIICISLEIAQAFIYELWVSIVLTFSLCENCSYPKLSLG